MIIPKVLYPGSASVAINPHQPVSKSLHCIFFFNINANNPNPHIITISPPIGPLRLTSHLATSHFHLPNLESHPRQFQRPKLPSHLWSSAVPTRIRRAAHAACLAKPLTEGLCFSRDIPQPSSIPRNATAAALEQAAGPYPHACMQACAHASLLTVRLHYSSYRGMWRLALRDCGGERGGGGSSGSE